jgi:hypothetical protein
MGIYKKTNIYVRQLCDEFFLEKMNLSKGICGKIKKGVLCLNIFFENCIVF